MWALVGGAVYNNETLKNYISSIKEELKYYNTFNINNAVYFLEQVLSLFGNQMYFSSVFSPSN